MEVTLCGPDRKPVIDKQMCLCCMITPISYLLCFLKFISMNIDDSTKERRIIGVRRYHIYIDFHVLPLACINQHNYTQYQTSDGLNSALTSTLLATIWQFWIFQFDIKFLCSKLTVKKLAMHTGVS